MSNLRIGQGWDLHRLVPARPLILGGVNIPAQSGELGHSDGDVLLHALIDALLGAAALGDIGSHFPPSDPTWKDAESSDLLCTVLALVEEAGLEVINIDATIILQSPKLSPYRETIRENLASLFKLPLDRISVKAKTKEGVDAAGRGEAIEAMAVVLLEEKDPAIWV
jgi:2-C-methyl-D-erythritol 2,4-cyclodiphosphate synthase